RVAILSDQTDWLAELDGRMHFSPLFEKVYNSYETGKSKYDPSQFTDVLADMGLAPRHALFIDDTEGHVLRARSQGLHAIHYRNRVQFADEMNGFFPGLVVDP
nr:HAD-IA family hydrolase [Deltaproteobacteria bacterium]